MSATGWEFPIDTADQWEGFNHPGIHHFRSSPISSLAREVIQNSLDAGIKRPVELAFKIRDVAIDDIPALDELRLSVQQCLKAAEAEGKKAKEFFTDAQKILKAKTISVLSISEKNTKGMKGPCKNGSPYYSYVKATGQSKKPETSSGDAPIGSFGIGKFAAFANSDLRTIFVSTVFEESKGVYKQFTQGKAIFMSHPDSRRRTRQDIGYWGNKTNCTPVEGVDPKLPAWLQQSRKPNDFRNALGTTIHILGFRAIADWENKLIASVIENFFAAIWKGALVVDVGKTRISRESIHELFESKEVRDSLAGITGQPENFDNSQSYFATFVRTEEIIIQDQENRELGNCEIRIVIGEGLPKRVAILRNGMLITDQLDRLKRFGDFKEFAAVIECQSTKGNELLRDMEPPQHNQFEPELLSSDDKVRGQRALVQLAQWAREMLRRHARDPISDVSDVRELADYFADIGEDDGGGKGGKGEEVNPIGKIEIRAQPLRRRAVIIDSEGDGTGGGGSGNGGGGNGGGGKKGDGKGTASGGSGKKADKTIELNNVRSVALTAKRRRLAVTPAFSGIMELALYEAGADTDRRLNVVKSSNGAVRAGLVRNIKAKRGSRLTLEVELDEPFIGAMKVAAYAI